MKINGLERYQNLAALARSGEGAAAKGTAAKVLGGNGNTDKITISEDAAARAEFRRVASALAAEADAVGGERLARLSETVQGGGYRVASEDIADAVLSLKV
jgi:anti-sigma28 factor (negative regulator of flagellin synthesis)